MMQRAGAASSAIVSAGRPPISASRARRAGSTSKPVTGMPASSRRRAYTSPIKPRPITATADLSAMRECPIQLARLAIERAGLQRALVDAVDRHHLGIITGRENLVRGFQVAVL